MNSKLKALLRPIRNAGLHMLRATPPPPPEGGFTPAPQHRVVSTCERSVQDIYIVGYPRSGHTWTLHLIADLICGIRVEDASGNLMLTAVPDLQLPWRTHYLRYREPMFFKTHALPSPTMKRVIYLVRDGRDATLSFFHFQRNHNPDSPPDLSEMFNKPLESPGTWGNHIVGWKDNPFSAEIIFVRYEDLLHDPAAELQRILTFANESRSEARIREAVMNCSFERLRQKELEDYRHVVADGKDLNFFRKGSTGTAGREVSSGDYEAFTRTNHDLLERLGYVTDP